MSENLEDLRQQREFLWTFVGTPAPALGNYVDALLDRIEALERAEDEFQDLEARLAEQLQRNENLHRELDEARRWAEEVAAMPCKFPWDAATEGKT